MEMMGGIGAAHVERRLGPGGADQPEVGEEGLHAVQIGGPEANVGDVGHADHAVAPVGARGAI